jgi:hypothetical protein
MPQNRGRFTIGDRGLDYCLKGGRLETAVASYDGGIDLGSSDLITLV